MAKRQPKTTDEAVPAGELVPESQDHPAETPPVPGPVAPQPLEIVLKRDIACGDRQCQSGDLLATIVLEPGVSLNYLVDAVRDHLAGPRE